MGTNSSSHTRVPFIFTNYTLGLLGMTFTHYLAISFPVLTFTACGYVLAFAGIFGENEVPLDGVCVIIITILLGRFALKHREKVQTELFDQAQDTLQFGQSPSGTKQFINPLNPNSPKEKSLLQLPLPILDWLCKILEFIGINRKGLICTAI